MFGWRCSPIESLNHSIIWIGDFPIHSKFLLFFVIKLGQPMCYVSFSPRTTFFYPYWFILQIFWMNEAIHPLVLLSSVAISFQPIVPFYFPHLPSSTFLFTHTFWLSFTHFFPLYFSLPHFLSVFPHMLHCNS